MKHCERRRHTCGEVHGLEERVRKLSRVTRNILDRQARASSRYIHAAKLLEKVFEFTENHFRGRRDGTVEISEEEIGDLHDQIEGFLKNVKP